MNIAVWRSGLSRLAHNQKIGGSNPSAATNGTLVQLVRAPPCHGGSRGFEFHTYRIAYKSTFWETLGGREDDCVIFVFVLA